MADAEELRAAAQAAVLAGLPAGRSLKQVELDVSRSHVRGSYSPDVAMLEIVVAALDVGQVDRERPLSTVGWREKYLPELRLHNRPQEVERLVYAFQTACTFRTGLQPSILDDTYGWGAGALWPHATRAAVMTVRAMADEKDLLVMCEAIARAVQPLEL